MFNHPVISCEASCCVLISRAISYIRFVVECKGVRNSLLEIFTGQSELSSIYEFISGYSLR